MIDGDDLAERLRIAVEALCDLARKSTGPDAARLTIKAQGVRLALSYVEEALRTQEATNADRG